MGKITVDFAKVSVIIPVYNTEKYLPKLFKSLENQTLREIEIILIDDKSTDGSRKLLDDFAKKDGRIKVLDNKQKGVSGARNLGMKTACGEYISFADSDDYLDENYFSELYSFAKTENADIALAYVKAEYENENVLAKFGGNAKAYENFYNIEMKKTVEKSKFREFGGVWHAIYRREMLVENDIFFQTKIKTGEDEAFQTVVSYFANKIVFAKNLTFYHRLMRENSLMTEFSDTENGVWSRALVAEFVVDFMNSRKNYAEEDYIFRVITNFNLQLFPRLANVKSANMRKKISRKIFTISRNVKYKNEVLTETKNDEIFAKILVAKSSVKIYEILFGDKISTKNRIKNRVKNFAKRSKIAVKIVKKIREKLKKSERK